MTYEPDLQVDVEASNDLVKLRISGSLDYQNKNILHQRLQEFMGQGKPSVEVNLSQVRYLDSSGASALVGAWNSMRLDGRSFGVVRPSPHVGRVLSLLRLEFLINKSDSSQPPQ